MLTECYDKVILLLTISRLEAPNVNSKLSTRFRSIIFLTATTN